LQKVSAFQAIRLAGPPPSPRRNCSSERTSRATSSGGRRMGACQSGSGRFLALRWKCSSQRPESMSPVLPLPSAGCPGTAPGPSLRSSILCNIKYTLVAVNLNSADRPLEADGALDLARAAAGGELDGVENAVAVEVAQDHRHGRVGGLLVR